MSKEFAFSSFDDEERGKENLPVSNRQDPSALATREPRSDIEIEMVRRGNDHTTISEFATPLFGLVVRVSNVDHFDDVESLHSNTQTAIETFRRDVQNEGYDINNLNAASYAICSLIDETVMGKMWGAESIWPSQTMLGIFHSETWGGDQFFAILERVLSEAQRYPDLLEFMQMCLLLGFEGKYHIMPNGEKRLDELMARIDEKLREINPDREKTRFVNPEDYVHKKKPRNVLTFFSPMGIFLVTILGLALCFGVLSLSLNSRTDEIATNLSERLNFYPNAEQGGQ